MIYKCPIFDVYNPEGFLTSQQTKYSKVPPSNFPTSSKFSDRNVQWGGRPLCPPIYTPMAVRFVSSANNRGFVLCKHRGKSLIYGKKNNGIKIEPWGTTEGLINRSDEINPFTWHFWLRFVRYDLNRDKLRSLTP